MTGFLRVVLIACLILAACHPQTTPPRVDQKPPGAMPPLHGM